MDTLCFNTISTLNCINKNSENESDPRQIQMPKTYWEGSLQPHLSDRGRERRPTGNQNGKQGNNWKRALSHRVLLRGERGLDDYQRR